MYIYREDILSGCNRCSKMNRIIDFDGYPIDILYPNNSLNMYCIYSGEIGKSVRINKKKN